MLAFTHPGKVGDLLYTLPTVKYLCEAKSQTCNFYTSDYCYPIVKRLLERQSTIDEVILPDGYKIQRMDMGVQPWEMPVDSSKYDGVYQLGFRKVPHGPLPQFIAESAGVPWNGKIHYDFDPIPTLDRPYIVLAPRGESSYRKTFEEVIANSPIDVVVIGAESDYIGVGINKCGLDLLDTLPWIANSKGFVGLMSSQLVLANGFDIPKVSPHDGRSWDMSHVIKTDKNFYPINPTAQVILELLGI